MFSQFIFPFYFRDSGTSLLSILWILFQVSCLFPFLFIWSCRFLPCSFICNILFCHLTFPFFLMGGIVFLPYWLFGLRLPALEFVSSWVELGLAAKMDLWETSVWWIFPGVWGSLLVQWFRLGAPTTGAQARPLAHEPRSHKPCRVAHTHTEKNPKRPWL